ncbi:ribose transport system permease protein [Kribbella sp. VKM Ac-2566]|nr:ribose transport system permease protein [Kribbella sp. VKM Ac-2566]
MKVLRPTQSGLVEAWRALRGRALPYLMLVMTFLVAAVTIDGLTTWPSLRSLLVLAALLGVASAGQTLVILLGGIDLSVPATIALGNVLTVQLSGRGWPLVLVLAAIATSAIAIGIVNGLASQLLRTHPLVVTLATGAIVIGLVQVMAQSQTAAVPEWISQVVSPGGQTLGMPIPMIVVVWALLAIVVVLALRFTALGRSIYATGASPEAARLALVRTRRVWVAAFTLAAGFGALSGIFLAGFTGTASAAIGDPYLFLTIAAVVVGGTPLLGGSGGYGRTVVGVIVINLFTIILISRGYSNNVQQILLGLLIVLLVSVYGRQSHIRDHV